MKKLFISLLFVALPTSSYAGWGKTLAGAAVGGVVAGAIAGHIAKKPAQPIQQPIQQQQPNNNTILWCQSVDGAKCVVSGSKFKTPFLTPPQFAYYSGYNTIYKAESIPCMTDTGACDSYYYDVKFLIKMEVK